jgi:hypothetical protein
VNAEREHGDEERELEHRWVRDRVPDPAQRAVRREASVPDGLLRVEKGERAADPEPQHERVEEEEGRGDGGTEQSIAATRRGPGEERERRQERDAGGPGEEREPRHGSGSAEPSSLGEGEAGEREQEEERLAVDRAEEDRGREERQVEHRAVCAVRAELR